MYDVIIAGGGPAGLTAALYCSRANLKTILIERAFSGGQMSTTSTIENYPGMEEAIGGMDLAGRMEKQAAKFGAQIINDNISALELDGKTKTVKTKNGEYTGKTIILSMGAFPRVLSLPGELRLKGAGVSYCATCDGFFYKDRIVAVVGGGDTAAEDSLYLSRICSKVYLIHRRDSLRATKILQNEVLKNKKIEVIWDTVIEDVEGEFSVESLKIKNIKTGEQKNLKTDGLFVAIGTIPSTRLVKDVLKLDEMGYVLSDDKMQTNLPGVFAAGDIRSKVLRQIITAASDGAVAAYMAERYISDNMYNS